jgi:hypothetical protein
MHPAGIKFGLSQGLLELRGAEVVVSGRFLENLSEMARRRIQRRKRVMCIWDEVVASGLRRTPYSLTDVPRQEIVPFFTGLDRVILISMMPLAEEIQMGRRYGSKYFISQVAGILNRDTRRCHARTRNEAWRFRFRQIYAAIIGLCKEYAPEHLRHAELLALCELNTWQTERENLAWAEFVKNLLRSDCEDV